MSLSRLSSRQAAVEESVAKIKAYYTSASRKLEKELATATTARAFRIRAIRKRIDLILGDLEKRSASVIRKELQDHYRDGLEFAAKEMQRQGIKGATVAFSAIDREAVKILADESLFYFAEAIKGVRRSSVRVLGEIQRRRIRAVLVEGKITGAARREISGAVSEILKREGIVALVDKGGKQWALDSYAEMLTRTSAIKSSNEGLMNRLLRDNFELVQVSVHNSNHEVCRRWEGRILSIRSGHPKYPSVDDAINDGIWHPNCRHRLLPHHPTLEKFFKEHQGEK